MKPLHSAVCTVIVLLSFIATTHAETQLRYVATIDVGPDWEQCKDLEVSGQHLFVGVCTGTGSASDTAALLVYDVSDPSATAGSPVGAVELPGGILYEIEVVAGLAYLAHDWFSLVDISNPLAPSLLCYYDQARPPTPYQTAFLGVAVSGDYAFIADHWQGLRVLDLSAPCPIIEVGGPLALEYFEHNVEIWGETAFAPTAHRPHGARLFAIDISTPSSLTVIGQIPLPLAAVRLVISEDGQHAYVACMEGGLHIVNIAQPQNMAQIGSYPLSLTRDVACEGDLVVVAEENTVVALEVTDPTAPTLLDSVPLPGAPTRITLEGGLVCASCQEVGKVVIFCLGAPPVANAGDDQTVEQESYDGTEVTLDGSGSTDPDSKPGTNDDIVSFEWCEGDTLLGNGEILDYTFSLGEHIVTLAVTDSCGETDDDEVTITVVDATPPDILLDDPEPSVLWPPNHKFVEVVIFGTAGDICDAGLDIDVSVEVLDAEGGDGGPNHDPDYEVICAGIVDGDVGIIVSLRAERSGKGDGRIYRITATVTDDSGNSTTSDPVEVTVPHDQSNGKGKGKK